MGCTWKPSDMLSRTGRLSDNAVADDRRLYLEACFKAAPALCAVPHGALSRHMPGIGAGQDAAQQSFAAAAVAAWLR